MSYHLCPNMYVSYHLEGGVRAVYGPSPTLSPTDPVPRGLLTLYPWASSGPQGLYTAYVQPIYSLYAAYIQPIYSL